MKNLFLLLLLPVLSDSNAEAQNNASPTGKMYFSNQPFTDSNTGSKTSFASNEYIYGRIELTGGTVKEAFKVLPPSKEKPYSVLMYEVTVHRDGKQMGRENMWQYCLLKEEDKNKTWLNFDILPEPSKATTLISGIDDFKSGLTGAPLYMLFKKDRFAEDGKYRIRIKIYSITSDAWGSRDPEEKWVSISDEFDFTFNIAEIATLNKNGKDAGAIVEANAFRYDKLPDVFSHPETLNDPKVTHAKIGAILKRDFADIQIIKFVVEKNSGSLWQIEKNNDGTITNRIFWPTIHIAYKSEGKCYVGTAQVIEQYEGGGRYGQLQATSTSEHDRSIDCSKLK